VCWLEDIVDGEIGIGWGGTDTWLSVRSQSPEIRKLYDCEIADSKHLDAESMVGKGMEG